MHIYAAGNFVLMSDPEKEKKFIKEVEKREGVCNRLISFFFKKELGVVMTINKPSNELLQIECPGCGALIDIDGMKKYAWRECYNCHGEFEYDGEILLPF